MKRVGAVCLLLVLLSTAACDGDSDSGDEKSSSKSSSDKKSTESQESQQSADIVVGDTGFVDGSIYAYLENREDREVPIDPGWIVYDGDNKKLHDPGGTGLYILEPNSKTMISSSVNTNDPNDISSVDAKPQVKKLDENSGIPEHGSGTLKATVLELHSAPQEATVAIENTYKEEVSGVEITEACKDAAGELNYVHIHFPDEEFPPESTTNIKTVILGNVETCEMYPHVTARTLFFKK